MSDRRQELLDSVRELGPAFAARAAQCDEDDSFVADNYAELRQRRLPSAAIPEDLGGGGATHSDMCAALRALAGHCGSTALAFSMHQHLIAALAWNHARGRPGRELLEQVANSQLMLISTGANDWLESNGEMKRVPGGYRVSAKKFFASGCPAGDILVTSARFRHLGVTTADPLEAIALEGARPAGQVLHFALPLSTEGVRIDHNWRAHGMRSTGSHTVVLEDVFVSEAAITLARPQGVYHPIFSLIVSVALPLICSVYTGIAEAAAAKALALVDRREDAVRSLLAGEMTNALTATRIAADSMVAIADDLRVEPSLEIADAMFVRKTLVVEGAIATTEKAMELAGSPGYFRAAGLERLLRDARAGHYHPMQPKRQQLFSGRLALGHDPL